MTWGPFLHGAVLFAVVWGSCGWIAWTAIARLHPVLGPASRSAGVGVVFTAVLVAVHLIPATLGILSRESVIVLTTLAVAGTTRLRRRSGTPDRGAPEQTPAWMWLLPALAGIVVVARALAHVRTSITRPPDAIDLLAFHLPSVVSWIQRGSIWHNDQFAPLFANGNYPQTADIPFLAAILPFSADFLVRVVVMPYWLLLGVTLYALARELGAPGPSSALAAVAVCAMPVVLEPTFAAVQIDVIMYAAFAAGVLFLVRSRRTGLTADLVLAGIAFGLAFGAKWYGVTTVAVVVVGWTVWQVVARRDRQALISGPLIGAVTAVVGGIWLVRNLVLTGNPVFPSAVEPLGISLFDAPRDVVAERFGFTISDYLTDADVLVDDIVPAWWRAFGLVGIVFAGAAVAAVAAVGWARRRRHSVGPGSAIVIALVGGAIAITAVYVVTPNTALGYPGHPGLVEENARYWVPAILLLGPLVALLTGRSGPLRPLGDLTLAAAAVQAAFLADAVSRPTGDVVRAMVLTAVAALALLIVVRLDPRRLAPPLQVAAAAAVLFVVVVAGHRLSAREANGRYAGEPVLAALQKAPAETRVGLAGSWTVHGLSPAFPAFGPRLRSEVEYVGPFRRHMLQDHADGRAFARALTEGAYDLLLVGPVPRIDGARIPFARWARQAGWREVQRDHRSILFAAPSDGRWRQALTDGAG